MAPAPHAHILYTQARGQSKYQRVIVRLSRGILLCQFSEIITSWLPSNLASCFPRDAQRV